MPPKKPQFNIVEGVILIVVISVVALIVFVVARYPD
jgi:competence protein ComGC